jgi:hypothetical protein
MARKNVAEAINRQAFVDAISHRAFGAALINSAFQNRLAAEATAR